MSLKYAKLEKVYPNWENSNKLTEDYANWANFPESSSSTTISEFNKILSSKNEITSKKLEDIPEEPPNYSEINIEDSFETLKNLKENQKLRNIKGKLVIETRNFSSVRRRISGDSRTKLLEDLNKLVDIATFNHNKLNILVDSMTLLKNSTYKNDKNWIELIDEIISRLKIIH